MPCASLAAAAFAPEAQQQAQVDGTQGAEVRHHPLIDVKFVLRKAPAEQDESPHIEFGESRSVVRSMSLSGSYAVPLNGGYLGPNMYVCSGWACSDSVMNAGVHQGSSK
jgi:hypothetical protein